MQLIFDLDGTLTDPFVGITTCIRYALEHVGQPAPAATDLRWCIGPPLRQSFVTLLGPPHAHLADEALLRYRERFGTVGLYENQLYPDIPATLEALRADGHTLRVASSKPVVYVRRIVEHFGLSSHFATVDGSELDGTRVDKGDLLAHVTVRDGLQPGETLMIGDREHDVRGAQVNGIAALGVLWGYGSRDELERAGAAACVGQPLDLPGVARAWMASGPRPAGAR
jgi:phosphoglycolate phosphatase